MRPSTRRISIPPSGTVSRAAVLAGVILGLVLALMAGCSPSSGIDPPQLLATDEIAALSAQATPGTPTGGDGIDVMAGALTGAQTAPATAHSSTADLGQRGDALRARAAALRGRDAVQTAQSDALRSRAEVLRQTSQARAAAVEGEGPDDEDDEEERRQRLQD